MWPANTEFLSENCTDSIYTNNFYLHIFFLNITIPPYRQSYRCFSHLNNSQNKCSVTRKEVEIQLTEKKLLYITKQMSFPTMFLKEGGGLMLFHACWVIYTVKVLDSPTNLAKVSKNDLDVEQSISVLNTVVRFHTISRSLFRLWLFMTSWRVELLIWHFSQKSACIDQSESKSSPSTRFIRQGLNWEERLQRSVFLVMSNR